MEKLNLVFFTFLFIHNCFSQAQDTIRLLAIGNSFSEDALEYYLHDLAKADGKVMIIGNMYMAGAHLTFHVENIKENKNAYEYRKINAEGVKKVYKNQSIASALKDEKWDYISLQQVSSLSGKYDTIMKSLPFMIHYVKKNKSKKTKLLYHQTWAYQKGVPHKGYIHYDNDQGKMYAGIVDATKKINKLKDIHMVIPAGTAIQNARTSSQGDTYTRDGYHLEQTYGRFTAACVWFEKLFGKDVRKISYKPEKITDKQAEIAKVAAHLAVKYPFKISKLKL